MGATGRGNPRPYETHLPPHKGGILFAQIEVEAFLIGRNGVWSESTVALCHLRWLGRPWHTPGLELKECMMKRTFIVIGLSAMLALPVLAIGQQTSSTPGTSGAGTYMQQQGQAGQHSQQAMNHAQIQQAQRQLKAAGFDPGPIDGVLGESTRGALREFQQAHGLPQTGQFDATTQQQLMAQAPQQSPGMQAPRESTPGSATSGSPTPSTGSSSGSAYGR